MSSTNPPLFGPFDQDMSSDDWFAVTLARIAEDEEERESFGKFVAYLRRVYKARDVCSLLELSQTQLYVAASETVGHEAKKGLVRMVVKHLGTPGKPHVPPQPVASEAMAKDTGNSRPLFGREGKSAMNSDEHNFPDAMKLPSSQKHIRHGDDIEFPEEMIEFVSLKADQFDPTHPMPQEVTLEIVREVANWIVITFGPTPVSLSCVC